MFPSTDASLDVFVFFLRSLSTLSIKLSFFEVRLPECRGGGDGVLSCVLPGIMRYRYVVFFLIQAGIYPASLKAPRD